MLLPTRHALNSAALLFLAASLASNVGATSTFSFPNCVDNCVASSGCESESSKCICKAAKATGFLDEVVKCMYYHCKDELRDVNDTFFTPVKTGCDTAKLSIPKADLAAAEKVASSLVSKLPKATTTTTATTTGITLNPTKAPPVPIGKTTSSSSSSTASTVARTSSNRSSSSEISAPTAIIVTPTSDVTTHDTPTTTQNAPGRVPTDSSPFATFDSQASRIGVGWLALTFIVALGLR